ncbi:hypothetical protein SRHO_G00112350 [Serrasalmus rhombeus]
MLQWCRNPGGGRQYIEGFSTAEREAINTLVHPYLASWWELQAVFQDAEKHWKQLEEQQVATHQMVRSLLAEQQPSVCVEAGTPFSPLLKHPVPPTTEDVVEAPPATKDIVEAPPATEDVSGTLAAAVFPDMPPSQTRHRPLRESLPTGRLGSPALPPGAGAFPCGVRQLRLGSRPELCVGVCGMHPTPRP